MSKRAHDTQKQTQTQALEPWQDQPWQEIVALLPAESRQHARRPGAFVRARGLRDPLDLLRGILTYVFCLTSFRQVSGWASSLQMSTNGARCWAKRTRQAAGWMLWIVEMLLLPTAAESREALSVPGSFAGRIHLVDATCVRTWRRNGESRRLHCSSDLLGQRLEQVVLTDQRGSEGLQRFSYRAGDIVVADSAYCRRKALFAQMDAGVGVLVRLHWAMTPLSHPDGTPFDLRAWLTSIEEQGSGEAPVVLRLASREAPMRLIAVHLSEQAATRAHRRRKEHARKHGRTNQALTIQIANWLVVLTSLSAQPWSSEHVLRLYRARWQVEFLFKRLKQLVRVHRLRSSQMQSNQAVLAALLVGWILLEQQASAMRKEWEEQTPTGEGKPISSWAMCAVLVQSFRSMLVGCWSWSRVRASLGCEAVTVARQQRPHQASAIVEHLSGLLSGSALTLFPL